MRRLGYFWRGLPLGSKLQFLAMALILGSVFVTQDLRPRPRVFGLLLWQVTAPLIISAFVLGRLLLPLMLRHPERAQRILSWFGMTVFLVSLLSINQRWGRIVLTHLGLTFGMWLDVSCWFWFISEIQQRAAKLEQQLDAQSGTDNEPETDFDDEEPER